MESSLVDESGDYLGHLVFGSRTSHLFDRLLDKFFAFLCLCNELGITCFLSYLEFASGKHDLHECCNS